MVDCRQIIRQVIKSERTKGGTDRRLSNSLLGMLRGENAQAARTTLGAQGQVGAAGMVAATSRLGAAPKAASATGAGRPKALPGTGGFSGGYVTLLGLGTGALLVGGGLLLRRATR